MLKINFSYTDEFQQESTLAKTISEDNLSVEPAFYMLVNEFKLFLLAAGFGKETVDTVIIDE